MTNQLQRSCWFLTRKARGRGWSKRVGMKQLKWICHFSIKTRNYILHRHKYLSIFSSRDSPKWISSACQEKAKARKERAKARARESRRRSNGFLGWIILLHFLWTPNSEGNPAQQIPFLKTRSKLIKPQKSCWKVSSGTVASRHLLETFYHWCGKPEAPMTKLGRLVNDGKINNLEAGSIFSFRLGRRNSGRKWMENCHFQVSTISKSWNFGWHQLSQLNFEAVPRIFGCWGESPFWRFQFAMEAWNLRRSTCTLCLSRCSTTTCCWWSDFRIFLGRFSMETKVSIKNWHKQYPILVQ